MASPESRKVMLQRWLQNQHFEEGTAKEQSQLLAELSEASVGGDPAIAGGLLGPEMPTEEVILLKDYAKTKVANPGDVCEKDVAKAVYYGAIAHALVYQGQMITRYSYEELKEALTMLLAHTWLLSPLPKLYQQAVAVCEERMSH